MSLKYRLLKDFSTKLWVDLLFIAAALITVFSLLFLLNTYGKSDNYLSTWNGTDTFFFHTTSTGKLNPLGITANNPSKTVDWEVYTNAFNAGHEVLMAMLYLNAGAAAAIAAWCSQWLFSSVTINEKRLNSIKKSISKLLFGLIASVISIIFAYFSYWGIESSNAESPLENICTLAAIACFLISFVLFFRGILVIYFKVGKSIQ